MYELVPAEDKHLDQMVPLLMSTGYWETGLKQNTQELSAHEFMKEFVAKPNLPYSTILVRKLFPDIVLGVVVCASKTQIYQILDHSPFMNPRVAALFANFRTHEMSESYHINFLAVSKNHRSQGLGRMLMEFAEKEGAKAGYSTLSLYTFGCQISSIKLYLKMGMMPIDAFTLSNDLPFPLVLYFEKTDKLYKLRDYFDTEEYKHLEL